MLYVIIVVIGTAIDILYNLMLIIVKWSCSNISKYKDSKGKGKPSTSESYMELYASCNMHTSHPTHNIPYHTQHPMHHSPHTTHHTSHITHHTSHILSIHIDMYITNTCIHIDMY